MVDKNHPTRRAMLKNAGSLGVLTFGASGVASASANRGSKSHSEQLDKDLFTVEDGEIKVTPAHENSPLEHTAERINRMSRDGYIETNEDSDGSLQIELNENMEQFHGKDQIGLLSHGKSSISKDRSAWGTPFKMHKVKFSSKLSEEFGYALGQGANYSTLLVILLGFLPYGQKLAAIAAAGTVYMYTRASRFDHHNKGHGVKFTFRWAKIPTLDTCGLILPGGTCKDINLGPFNGPVVFYDSNWGSQ